MGTRRRILCVALAVSALAAGAAAHGLPAPSGVRGACIARGKLIVDSSNQVRFSAKGFCGPLTIEIFDTLGPFASAYPQWTGGCGYGPGPFPQLRLAVVTSAPGGVVVSGQETFWFFPDLVVGNDRFTAPYSTNRILIRQVQSDPYGRPTSVGAIIGHGVLLTRLNGSCNVRDPAKATATVVFVIHDGVNDALTLP